MCFYRRRDLPPQLIQLADKHQCKYHLTSLILRKFNPVDLLTGTYRNRTPIGTRLFYGSLMVFFLWLKRACVPVHCNKQVPLFFGDFNYKSLRPQRSSSHGFPGRSPYYSHFKKVARNLTVNATSFSATYIMGQIRTKRFSLVDDEVVPPGNLLGSLPRWACLWVAIFKRSNWFEKHTENADYFRIMFMCWWNNALYTRSRPAGSEIRVGIVLFDF